MEWNSVLLLEFHDTFMIEEIKMETTFGIVFPSFLMFLDFFCWNISVMCECYSLLEYRPYNIHRISRYNQSLISDQISFIDIHEREMSLNAPASVIIRLLISYESQILQVPHHSIEETHVRPSHKTCSSFQVLSNEGVPCTVVREDSDTVAIDVSPV